MATLVHAFDFSYRVLHFHSSTILEKRFLNMSFRCAGWQETRANSLHEAIAAMEMRKLVVTAEVQDYYCRSEPKQYQQRRFRGGGDISRSLLNLLLAQNFNVLKGLLRVELTQ
ncbi:hypothetical protein OIU76_003872 [Salix suchowensis]|nr:hypothetical protein OIU76_003872 [Salix suchowensis]